MWNIYSGSDRAIVTFGGAVRLYKIYMVSIQNRQARLNCLASSSSRDQKPHNRDLLYEQNISKFHICHVSRKGSHFLN